jgi:hypothetical protein
VVGSCEYDNEPSGSINASEFLDKLDFATYSELNFMLKL